MRLLKHETLPNTTNRKGQEAYPEAQEVADRTRMVCTLKSYQSPSRAGVKESMSRQVPRLLTSSISDNVYIVTSYEERDGLFIAREKFNVTKEVNAIIKSRTKHHKRKESE